MKLFRWTLSQVCFLFASAATCCLTAVSESSEPPLKLGLKLSDLRAGQPAVGKDQIAYLVGRFNGVVWPADISSKLNGALKPGLWYSDDQKMFEDVAETNGQTARPDQIRDNGKAYKTDVYRWSTRGADAFPGDPDNPAISYSVTFSGKGQLKGSLVLPGNNLTGMKTVVVAPDRNYYLTDGHHSTLLYSEMKRGGDRGATNDDFTLYLALDRDYSNLADENNNQSAMDEFWIQAANDGKVWLKQLNAETPGYDYLPGVTGRADKYHVDAVDLKQFDGALPDNMVLDEFKDDPYRGVLYFCRDIGWNKPTTGPAAGLPFLEFYWAEEIQKGIAGGERHLDLHTPDSPYDLTDLKSYRSAVKAVSKWIVGLDPNTKIGTSGFTAEDMGQLGMFGEDTFDQLIDASETVDGDVGKTLKPAASDEPGAEVIGELPKPGKWAYAWAVRYADVPARLAPVVPAAAVR